MKKRKVFAVILAVVITFASAITSFYSYADDVSWNYNPDTKTLSVFGNGNMSNYEDEYGTPWYSVKDEIVNLNVESGVTSVGSFAFSGMSMLKNVRLADTVTEINAHSFSSCSSLTELEFSSLVTSIEDSSFAYDANELKENFKMKVFAGSYALNFAVKNSVDFDCVGISCSKQNVEIKVKGMKAYFPYTPKCDGSFTFFSSGNHDTMGNLYDSDFNLINSNDDMSDSNSDFSLTADLKKDNTYYFEAHILNASLTGIFSVTLKSNSFSGICKIVAASDIYGTPSDIYVDGAYVDSELCGSEFTVSSASQSVTIVIKYQSQEKPVTFTPDSDFTVSFIACDVNNDGWINAKDFALMKQSGSKYLPLFNNFINYHLQK